MVVLCPRRRQIFGDSRQTGRTRLTRYDYDPVMDAIASRPTNMKTVIKLLNRLLKRVPKVEVGKVQKLQAMSLSP